MVTLKIEKLVEGGQGIAHKDEQTYFVWNALPEEEVEVEILNKKKGIYEALAVNILKPSPHRVKPVEDHYLSCSPWQIMDEEYENEQKTAIAVENYQRIGGFNVGAELASAQSGQPQGSPLQIATDGNQFGYRNKMEFSFIENNSKISLAFFHRGTKRKTAIEDCKLATPEINETAIKILDWINENGLTERNLKALIVRSNLKGETIAGLFIKDRVDFKKYPELKGGFIGFNLYYSTHKSPASVITEVLYQEGQDFLVEEIDGVKFKYGINSFFQVNIPVFEMALEEISKNVTKKIPIVDFYSGVGTIGLSLAKNVKNVQLVESNEEAVEFANENIILNKTVGAHCHAPTSAEKALELIGKDSTIIFDPPRAGLHPKVIERILEVQPQKIIYLSCNTATHARDIGLLKELYDIKLLKLYNFFPRTPHIEGLAVLEIKD